MEKTHISSQFDADLEDIRTRLLQMGGLVEEQVRAATEYYGEHKSGMAERIREVEAQVNQLELELDDRCTHLIVRRQPAAGDLRLVMAVVKTITDLERIGDEADKIARYSKAMHDRGLLQLPGFSDIHVAAHIAAGSSNGIRRLLHHCCRCLAASTAPRAVASAPGAVTTSAAT